MWMAWVWWILLVDVVINILFKLLIVLAATKHLDFRRNQQDMCLMMADRTFFWEERWNISLRNVLVKLNLVLWIHALKTSKRIVVLRKLLVTSLYPFACLAAFWTSLFIAKLVFVYFNVLVVTSLCFY